eukprot:151611_1
MSNKTTSEISTPYEIEALLELQNIKDEIDYFHKENALSIRDRKPPEIILYHSYVADAGYQVDNDSTSNEIANQNNHNITQNHDRSVTNNAHNSIDLYALLTNLSNSEPNIPQEEEKYEKIEQTQEEEKYVQCKNENIITMVDQNQSQSTFFEDRKKILTKFVSYRVDDYISCNHENDHENGISKCKQMQRIIHLLEYYKHSQATVLVYEYISSLNEYTISSFMEDWYHCKTTHFKTQSDYEWIANKKEINCNDNNNKNCIYQKRHKRERGQEIYVETQVDHKNVILRDQLDSIHAFIFHAISQRTNDKYKINKFPSNQVPYEIQETHDVKIVIDSGDIGASEQIYNSEIDNLLHKDETNIWINNPTSITECNIKQIIEILNTEYIWENLNKLSSYKHKIIKYTEEHIYDGNTLYEMKRKGFIIQMAQHLGNNKLKGQLGLLYRLLMDFDFKHVTHVETHSQEQNDIQKVLLNDPTTIRDCTLDQIVHAFNNVNIFDNLDKLLPYKNKIIDYIIHYKLNGAKLCEMKRKEFMIQISQYFDNTQLRGQLGVLYDTIMNLKLTEFGLNDNKIPHLQKNVFDESEQTDANNLNKFVTSANMNSSYYSFGEQFRYTPNLVDHPLFVEPKYQTLKQEVFEHIKSINEEFDINILLQSQLQTINSLPPEFHKLKPLLKKIINEETINDNDINCLWNNEYKLNVDDGILQLIKLENKNCLFLIQIMGKLFQNLPNDFAYFTNYIFVKLLDLCNQQQFVNTQIRQHLEIYLQNLNNNQLKLLLKEFGEIRRLMDQNQNQLNLTSELKKILGKCYRNMFNSDDEDSANYLVENIKWAYYYKHSIQTICNHLENITNDDTNNNISSMDDVISSFYTIMQTNQVQLYDTMIKNRCEKYVSLKQTAKEWALQRQFSGTLFCCEQNDSESSKFLKNADMKQKAMMRIFQINYQDLKFHLQMIEHDVRMLFIRFAKETLLKAVIRNRDKYIDDQNNERCQYYIQKSILSLNMYSVKQLKAIWYHGMNEHHDISTGDPLRTDHILALICYTSISTLCTSFRETYRRIDQNESIKQQKVRHKVFANMGRLLYEAFIFYASKDSKVQVLYHGMSIALLFPTLHCSFDCPTSTTTEPAVAVSFGQGNGIILKFESCDSSRYIRTLDMGLFSCFDEEYEHLIFETRVHMKDIAIPSEKGWIGYKWMKVILLYDLLVQGRIIHNSQLLKKGNQNRLCKMLQLIMDDNLSYKSQYFTTLVLSVTQHQQKIWLNTQQIQELNTNLKKMFVEENNQFGEFIVYLKNQFNLVICPIFITKWKMSEYTFDLISRVTEKYDNIGNIQGHIIRCNLPNNKQVVFRPQLIKTHKLFNVRMELIDVSDNRSITVHFEIECRELNTYYTSSHPKLMDTKHYNEYVITLPTITQDVESISLGISIMIHNFEDFNVDYKNFNKFSKLTVMTENMIRKSRSYKMVDSLSIFYG